MIARIPTRLLPLLLLPALGACGDDEPTSPQVDPEPAAVQVTPASDSLAVTGTLQLEATVTDADGNVLDGQAVTWASSDENVATVSSSGEATGVGSGAAEITATVGSLSAAATLDVFAGLAEVDDAGGSVEAGGGSGAGGATLEVPAGAVPAGTTITAVPTDAAAVVDGAIPGTAWEFGPDGLTFASPASLTLAYAAADLPAGADPSALVMVRASGTGLERLAGLTVDDAGGTVHAEVPGFSRFALCLPGGAVLCGGDPVTDLDVSLVASRSSPEVGDTLTYTMTVANQGPNDLTDGSVTLVASGPVGYAPGFTPDGACAVDAGQGDIGVSCALGALAVGESRTFDLQAAATGEGDVVAVAGPPVLPSSEDPDAANDVAELALTVAPATSPLIVLSSDSLAAEVLDIAEGGTAPTTVSSVITNGGPGALEGLATTVSYTDGSSGWLTSRILTNQFQTVALVDVDQTGLAQGTYTGAVTVSSTNAANSPQEIPVVMEVLPGADLGTAVSNVPDSVNVGDTIRYEVVVSNAGPSAAPESELEFFIIGTLDTPDASLIPDGCELEELDGGGRYRCSIVDLGVGDSVTVNLVAIPQVSGDLIRFGTNTFVVSGAIDPQVDAAITGSTQVR